MFTVPCHVFIVPEFPFRCEISIFHIGPFLAVAHACVEFVDLVEMCQFRAFVQLCFFFDFILNENPQN